MDTNWTDPIHDGPSGLIIISTGVTAPPDMVIDLLLVQQKGQKQYEEFQDFYMEQDEQHCQPSTKNEAVILWEHKVDNKEATKQRNCAEIWSHALWAYAVGCFKHEACCERCAGSST